MVIIAFTIFCKPFALLHIKWRLRAFPDGRPDAIAICKKWALVWHQLASTSTFATHLPCLRSQLTTRTFTSFISGPITLSFTMRKLRYREIILNDTIIELSLAVHSTFCPVCGTNTARWLKPWFWWVFVKCNERVWRDFFSHTFQFLLEDQNNIII